MEGKPEIGGGTHYASVVMAVVTWITCFHSCLICTRPWRSPMPAPSSLSELPKTKGAASPGEWREGKARRSKQLVYRQEEPCMQRESWAAEGAVGMRPVGQTKPTASPTEEAEGQLLYHEEYERGDCPKRTQVVPDTYEVMKRV